MSKLDAIRPVAARMGWDIGLAGLNPYALAREAFLAGKIHSSTAVGLIAQDRDFIAEVELNHGLGPNLENVELAARRIVEVIWLPSLVDILAGKGS